VMDLVRTRTTVPVPDVVHLETSTEWLEVPFLVMRAVDGVVPSDNPPYLLDPGGWFLQGTPQQWRRFEQSTLDVFVRLHRIRDDGDETAFLQLDAPGATSLARQVADLRVYYEWARGEHTIPILERGVEVVTETMPTNDRSVLNWGDGRPGNIIYRDFEPAAVLDWEMATLAPPEVDVAWTTFFQKFFAAMAEQYGLPPFPPCSTPSRPRRPTRSWAGSTSTTSPGTRRWPAAGSGSSSSGSPSAARPSAGKPCRRTRTT